MTRKRLRLVLILCVLASLAASVFTVALGAPQYVENLAGYAGAGEGKTWVATNEGSRIWFRLLNSEGTVQRQFSIRRVQGGRQAQVADMAVDAEGTLFYLLHYSSPQTGALLERQELAAYRPRWWPFGRHKSVRLDSETETSRFLRVQAGSSVTLTGTSQQGDELVRRTLDTESLLKNRLLIKQAATAPLAPGEGVYTVVSVQAELVYISKTGRVYASGEAQGSQPRQLYPLEGEGASYASFLTAGAEGAVVVGQQTGGGILRLYVADGAYEYLLEAGQAFAGAPYTGQEILGIKYAGGGEDYTALAQNPETRRFEFLASQNGEMHYLPSMRLGLWTGFLRLLGRFFLYLGALLFAALCIRGIWKRITGSRTLLPKLVFASVPLMVLALALFGAYSYFSYQSALSETYQSKVTDQGDLLRALFTTGSFDAISSPEHYNSTEYQYLSSQMETRDLYTSSGYFVDTRLYTGPDDALPFLYPFGITQNTGAYQLYRTAALTGRQQTGVIDDGLGARIACVTPVGSSSGDMVFLVETAIFEAQISDESSGFLLNYLIIALVCIVGSMALMILAFSRAVHPLRQLLQKLESFATGDRTVRVTTVANDEIADIGRVFNKMAGEIDAQIYDLETMSDIYYRFVPQRMLQLLGLHSLSAIRLGSEVCGTYSILSVALYPHSAGTDDVMEMTNSLFAIVHTVANAHNATLLSDSVGLGRLKLICPTAAAAVDIASEAIGRVDAANAGRALAARLDVTFFLHAADIRFVICGDEERYIPSLLSATLDMAERQCEDYLRLGSRLLVSGEAFALLEQPGELQRFIGYAPSGDPEGIALYDFFGTGQPAAIQRTRATQNTFEKAIEMYHQQRYYDAKNLFTAVLRENQHDNVARHYIFLSEKHI